MLLLTLSWQQYLKDSWTTCLTSLSVPKDGFYLLLLLISRITLLQSWILENYILYFISSSLCLCTLSHFVVSNSLRPHTLQPTRLLCPRGFSRQEYWSGLPCPPPGDLPNPEIKSRSPTLQADSLLTGPPGKPKSTGVGSLSLLQGIFPP